MLVIGLDGADPSLVFDRLKDRMPFVNELATRGVHGPLRSTDPPVTIPAWVSMFTGRDPGELGLYGFRNRISRAGPGLAVGETRRPRTERVWDRLSRAGRTCFLLGVPGTYPPWPIRGRMVAGFLAPGATDDFTWPRGLAEQVHRLAGPGGYTLDAEGYRTDDKDRLLAEIHAVTRRRFRVARAWAAEPTWDLMVAVEMGPDRMHHGFWRDFDPGHRLHVPDGPYAAAIPDYYAYVDDHVRRLVEAAGPGVAVMIVSDHGARAMQGAFAINRWLIEQGDLVLDRQPGKAGALDPARIDWTRTRAWADGGYHARVWINLAGREPSGCVPGDGLEAYRADLAARLEATRDESGRPLGTRVVWPHRTYARLTGIPPDLLVYFGDLAWRASAQVGPGPIHLRENDTGPDDANHARDGIFVFADPATGRDRLPVARKIVDIASLVIDWFGRKATDEGTHRCSPGPS